MRSYMDVLGRIIDCRYLCLEGSFVKLTLDEVNAMAQDFYDFIEKEFGDNCVITWEDERKRLPSIHPKRGGVFLGSSGEDGFFAANIDIRGSAVYNKATQKKQRSRMGNDISYWLIKTPSFHASVGYPEYYASEIQPYLHDSKTFLSALHKLYDLEDKYYINRPYTHDIQASIIVFGTTRWDISTANGNKGVVRVRILLYSIEYEPNEMAEKLLGFAKEISKKYVNFNASIFINTNFEDYMDWFNSFGELSEEILSRASLGYHQELIYLQNVGWSHIVAPYTKVLLDGDCCRSENIITEDLQGGGMLIKYNKPISEMTIEDLKEMKKYIYSMLISGKSHVPVYFDRFRSKWEYVPVLDDEIRIEGDNVIFEHIGGPNVKHIKDVLQLKSGC